MTVSGREQASFKPFLETLKKNYACNQVAVVSTMPRGDLQVTQPVGVSPWLLKIYDEGYDAEDRLTWECVTRGKILRPNDCWSKAAFAETAYYRDWMAPARLRHVVAIPLAAPVLEGYPGALHLARTEDEGEFTDADVRSLEETVRRFDEQSQATRYGKSTRGKAASVDRPVVRLAVVDAQGRVKAPKETWNRLDERLRDHILDFSRRRAQALNGHGELIDRLLLPDTHGDNWSYRVITYKKYPALSDGPVSVFCLQPTCHEWGALKVGDFGADPELSRLLASVKFMQQRFSDSPTLVDIAKQVELSPFHFHRRFTELLGLTPKQFLLECQIDKAKTELVAEEKELVRIARECGFAHQSHFTSRFKQATGLTPTRWRRMAHARLETLKG